ncbi:gamma-glutamylcyclotransferase family protein [Oricola cellulosilytica]|uniref:Gamma-glutamylcyclotransferase n=1 Tax=Oricola cellulosilytica TaxID=1429082 RepID=A0A4R0P781_9HYPH|nr:gamma-glutamylcyclotransferase family protein [Oricola cellulosilytica]TCD11804.1 gamma-glutamylcyclotransferase [Oricola cellulosilytica]
MWDEIGRAAAKGDLFAYFGYGSLVNRATHRTRILGAAKASVRGWRRHWQARPDPSEEGLSFLSVKPDVEAGHDLPGLLVFDHIENLDALDRRELGYDRRVVARNAIVFSGDFEFDGPVFIYEARPPARRDAHHSILQSYLDAVLQGYLREYGEDHVRRFILETHAFDTPVIQDRHVPRYTRHVLLEAEERAFIDSMLREHGVSQVEA